MRQHLPNVVVAALALAVLLMLPEKSRAQDLPPVPETIRKQGVVRVGVKCDYPPDGFMDAGGKPQGVEVSLARQIAVYAFGSADKAELACVTAANRIPSLLGGKVDVVIATLGVTEERAKVVDFGESYAWGGSDVLVRKDSGVRALKDFAGKKVIAMKGAWQIGWFEKNVPTTELLKLDSVSDGLQALLQGRADGFAHDIDVLRPIAFKNDGTRLVGEIYQMGTRAPGFRKGESEWVQYVNAVARKAYKEGLVAEWIRQHVEGPMQPAVIDTWNMSKAPKS